MSEKILNSRIQLKHDTEENWGQAKKFIPEIGEVILYDADTKHTIPRVKIGNKKDNVESLPFFFDNFSEEEIIDLLTNRVNLSINPNGSIYNNGEGYKRGYRIRSSGAEVEFETAMCSGYIEVKPNDVISISHYKAGQNTAENSITVYNASFEVLGQVAGNYPDAGYGIFANGATYQPYCWNSGTTSNGTFTWTLPPADAGIAYIRVCGWNNTVDKLKVVINGG